MGMIAGSVTAYKNLIMGLFPFTLNQLKIARINMQVEIAFNK
jgi:hypothetical protein